MKQSVNLLTKEFSNQQPAVNFYLTIGLLTLEIAALTGLYFIQANEVLALEQSYFNTQQNYDQQSNDFEERKNNFQPKTKDPKLGLQITRLRTEKKGKASILKALEGGKLGKSISSSYYLEAFANLITEGMWLTEIEIHPLKGEITLVGKTLKPQLIPQYVKALSQSDKLYGLEFSSFRLNRTKPTDQFLNFRLSTKTLAPTTENDRTSPLPSAVINASLEQAVQGEQQ